MGVPTPQGRRTARGADASALIGASSRAYGWLRKLLTFYGTAVTVAQLVPAVVALVVVFVSPTAWLSATLRRWVALGAVGGTVDVGCPAEGDAEAVEHLDFVIDAKHAGQVHRVLRSCA